MRFLTFFSLISFSVNAFSQFYVKKDHLEYGFNIGTYIANNNTSILYDAHTYVASSLEIMLNRNSPNYRYISGINFLDTQFGGMGNWVIDNDAVPAEMSYNPGFLIGIHVGKHHPKFKYYLDYNLADINVTGTSQVVDAIYNPGDANFTSPVIISVRGRERRNLFNLGVVLDFINEDDFHLGIPFELQLNQVTLINNEIYLDGVNQAHTVNHIPANLTNTAGNNNPGGFGIGGGSGLVLTLDMAENIMLSFGYQGYFAQSNFLVNLSPWGLQHTAFARMIWMKE
ncbi:MAG: hypothetical protein VXY28_06390 [Bacteroidota bacterium]|nr:hypothetical protein [Bacteroidota bacterium]